MSLDTPIADKQDIHTLTTLPGPRRSAFAPADAAQDVATEQAITDPFNPVRKAPQEVQP
jgi:hypothetical protein